MAKSLVKAISQKVLGNYGCYRIFACDLILTHLETPRLEAPYRFAEVGDQDIHQADEPLIRDQEWYAGTDAHGFGIYHGTRLVCVQWLWYGERYKTRNFWPLENGEAKSVQLVTVSSERGKGLATKLKLFSAVRMKEMGFSRLYSRTWCTHNASIRVNEKAGWRQQATVVEVYPFGASRPWRVVKRRRTEHAH